MFKKLKWSSQFRVIPLTLSVAFFMSGCLAPPAFVYPEPITMANELYSATLSVSCHDELGYKTCTDFELLFSNKSNENIKINWNDSVIVKDGVGGQLTPSGTKYQNANENKPNSIVPAGMDITTIFVPSNNIYYSTVTNSWSKLLIMSGNYTLVLATETANKKDNIKFNFSILAPK